jgi:PAS domain S-box-containing protein
MEAHLEKGRLIIDNENDFLREIIDSISASIHILKVDNNGNTLPVWMNAQYSEMLGYSFDERHEIGFADKTKGLYHPDDIDIIKNSIKILIENKKAIHAALYRVKNKNGDWIWMFSSARSITINNDPDYLLCVNVNVTDKLAKYQLLLNRYTKEIANLKNELVLKNLTKTEKEIISLLTRGLTTREIAQQRIRSYETINNHKRNIFKKLNLHNIAELVAFAKETGLG